MIDVKVQLTKDIARLDALNGKNVQTVDLVQELASQVWALSNICMQQQEQIDTLLKRSMGGIF